MADLAEHPSLSPIPPPHPPPTPAPLTPQIPTLASDPTSVERTATNHRDMERAKQTDRIIAKSPRSHTAWSLDFTETVITTYLFLSSSWWSEWLNVGQSRLRRKSETLCLHGSSFFLSLYPQAFDRTV